MVDSARPYDESDISSEDSDSIDLSGLMFDLFDGGVGTIADYEGTPLVVNFFASWCPPCVRKMPEFQEVFDNLDGQVAFLGLSQDQSAQDALNLVQATGVTYDVGWDIDLEVYGATGWGGDIIAWAGDLILEQFKEQAQQIGNTQPG